MRRIRIRNEMRQFVIYVHVLCCVDFIILLPQTLLEASLLNRRTSVTIKCVLAIHNTTPTN